MGEWIGLAEAAARAGVSVDAIRSRVRAGSLEFRQEGKGIQVFIPDEEQTLSRHRASEALEGPVANPFMEAQHTALSEGVSRLRAEIALTARGLEAADSAIEGLGQTCNQALAESTALTERVEALEAQGTALGDGLSRLRAEMVLTERGLEAADGAIEGLRQTCSQALADSIALTERVGALEQALAHDREARHPWWRKALARWGVGRKPARSA